jgi:hypothetical protein
MTTINMIMVVNGSWCCLLFSILSVLSSFLSAVLVCECALTISCAKFWLNIVFPVFPLVNIRILLAWALKLGTPPKLIFPFGKISIRLMVSAESILTDVCDTVVDSFLADSSCAAKVVSEWLLLLCLALVEFLKRLQENKQQISKMYSLVCMFSSFQRNPIGNGMDR